MGCRDPDLVEKIGAVTALETRASGVQYAFAPCVAVSCLWYELFSSKFKIIVSYMFLFSQDHAREERVVLVSVTFMSWWLNWIFKVTSIS